MGEATRVYCRTQRLNPGVAGEDAATIVLDHDSGAVTVVEISFFAKLDPDPFPQTLVRIEGDAGTLDLAEGYRLTTVCGGRSDARSVEPPVPAWGERPWHGIQSSVYNIQAHWLDCLATGAEPRPSGADNLRTLDLVFKAYESAESGRAVPVEADRLAA
jgi:predicted dehydrogenase